MNAIEKQQQVARDLREKLHEAEKRQTELVAERDKISYLALTGDAPARKRLSVVNAELSGLTGELASIEAALVEAAKREKAAEEAQFAKRRSDDALAAEVLLSEAEAFASALDDALKTVRQTASELEAKLNQIRRSIGAGPTADSIRTNLRRALVSAAMGGPMHIVHLAPGERVTLAELAAPWARSIRNRIQALTGNAANAA
ncbi:hypothetical protein [Bradyrhizobium guangdongense]|uniref:Uncharacterized protein n=1 Tax=Bradyrhizobium guangdongense TaxID=1325090 RepID=A0A410V7A4_9BRAD|nr:hypothetical protein [Bradyrhizobium guangdongense]QAU39591.1 hypothetical protein X265_19430 [Bradyrhizobium guangdongense]QOZ60652.1 hypothetical protein XH86_19440 [Bradyrhizobium guangdongense]GGI24139.1 hypothetical protein GCM10010987_27890 [Bradyrhizobium guangdongense]